MSCVVHTHRAQRIKSRPARNPLTSSHFPASASATPTRATAVNFVGQFPSTNLHPVASRTAGSQQPLFIKPVHHLNALPRRGAAYAGGQFCQQYRKQADFNSRPSHPCRFSRKVTVYLTRASGLHKPVPPLLRVKLRLDVVHCVEESLLPSETRIGDSKIRRKQFDSRADQPPPTNLTPDTPPLSRARITLNNSQNPSNPIKQARSSSCYCRLLFTYGPRNPPSMLCYSRCLKMGRLRAPSLWDVRDKINMNAHTDAYLLAHHSIGNTHSQWN